MPTASSITNKVRVAAESKNSKVEYPKGVAWSTPKLQSACGHSPIYSWIDYREICDCKNIALR